MLESLMYVGIGFLLAALVAVGVMSLVHNRAVRLTRRRMEAASPPSIADVQAEKDLLRAEFAMSTRRLEMTVEQLNEKYTSQLVELGRKGNAVSRLETERNAQQAEIVALKIQLDALHDQVAAGAERRVHGDAVPLVPTTFSASPSLAEHPAGDAFSAMPTDR